MRQILLLLYFVLAGFAGYFFIRHTYDQPTAKQKKELQLSQQKVHSQQLLNVRLCKLASNLKEFGAGKNYSDQWALLIDLSIHSGRKRFFIYDLKRDTIHDAGLVAHGNCNNGFLDSVRFSNNPGSGCSSIGRYRVGYHYEGRFGKSYKLFGLESTNSNAFSRSVVLHAYECVPDEESFPYPICNSLGCPMVSMKFMKELEHLIDNSERPILLWIIGDAKL